MKHDIRYAIYEPRVTSHELRTEAGVTLVEILIVLGIIVLLASIVIGMATHITNQSRAQSLQNTFGVLESALEEYHEYTGAFPDPNPDGTNPNLDPNMSSQILYRELHSIPNSRKILEQIRDSLIDNRFGAPDTPPEIYDPWGKVLDYIFDPATDSFPQLVSAGPDRTFADVADNISSRR